LKWEKWVRGVLHGTFNLKNKKDKKTVTSSRKAQHLKEFASQNLKTLRSPTIFSLFISSTFYTTRMLWLWRSVPDTDSLKSISSTGTIESDPTTLLTASIVSRSVARAKSVLYTIYRVKIGKILEEEEDSWMVWRRYSEFRTLYFLLCDSNDSIPPLPGKKIIGTFEPRFLDSRQKGLNEWLTEVLDMRDTLCGMHHLDNFFEESYASHKPILSTHPELSSHRVCLEDFETIQVIGRGSFGKVVAVRRKQTSNIYAMKILRKSNIRKRKQVEHTKTERRVMERIHHPFIVDLHYAFQTNSRLYLVLEYIPGGELFFHLGRYKRFQESWALVWTGEIVLALQHLHGLNIIFRDLKPENILFDAEGHIKLVDFGLSKDGIEEVSSGADSFCGTPEYLAPEILNRQGHGKAVDFWNLGMVLYEMLTGLPPWYSRNKKKLFDRLKTAPLKFPDFVSKIAKNIIRGFLNRDPTSRLGSNGFGEIKNHPFFGLIDWDKLYRKEIRPGFKPKMAKHSLSDPVFDFIDTSNFDSAFTSLPLYESDDSDQDSTFDEDVSQFPDSNLHNKGFQEKEMYYNFSFHVN